MNFLRTSEIGEHLSAFLNAYERSLPAVEIQQDSVRRINKILKIICEICGNHHLKIFGSLAEGLDIPASDGDFILFGYKYKVLDSLSEFNPFLPMRQVLRLPDKRYPGYSKLGIIGFTEYGIDEKHQYQDDKDGKRYLRNNVKEGVMEAKQNFSAGIDFSIHGPAFKTEFHYEKVFPQFSMGTPLFSIEKDHSLYDFVWGLKSKKWPIEAYEWKIRRRVSDWPTTELFDLIIKTGYILAGVGSKESTDREIQWRVSFNKAEQLIIKSLNETQMQCILLLKFIRKSCLSDIAGKNITSYSMKTVMFWCLEEKSESYWQSSNLVHCLCFCMSKLKSFVEKAFLPNYFIRKRNHFNEIEFTCDIQIKTLLVIEGFLKIPKASICLFVKSYRKHESTPISIMNIRSQKYFIARWLMSRVLMAYQFQMYNDIFVLDLYDGYNIQNSLIRFNMALEKISRIRYTQPLIKNLQNYLGVLQYLLLKEEKETGEIMTDSDARGKYLKCMKLSASGDLTHANLRIATCYLDEGVKEDCIKKIRTVTDSDDSLFNKSFYERLHHMLTCDIEAFNKKQYDANEYAVYNRIIYDVDYIDQDPYRTTDEFEQLKERGHVLIGYDSLSLAWKGSYFDVTFMLVELPVLPKPAALELCIDYSQKHVSFHPFLYGLLLEFLWHHKYGSGDEEKKSVLKKMKNCVPNLPFKQKCSGLNFMTYCFSLQNDYCSASKCLIQSFNLNPVTQNVAHLYMKYIAKQLLELSYDSKICILYSRMSDL